MTIGRLSMSLAFSRDPSVRRTPVPLENDQDGPMHEIGSRIDESRHFRCCYLELGLRRDPLLRSLAHSRSHRDWALWVSGLLSLSALLPGAFVPRTLAGRATLPSRHC